MGQAFKYLQVDLATQALQLFGKHNAIIEARIHVKRLQEK